MTSADKFGIGFTIAITAVMIGLVSCGTFDVSQPSPVQSKGILPVIKITIFLQTKPFGFLKLYLRSKI